MSADTLIAQIITDKGKLFLYLPFRDREYQVCFANAITQAIIFNVLLNYQRDSKNAWKEVFFIIAAICF